MTRRSRGLAVAVLALLASPGALACGEALGASASKAENGHYVVVYRTQPSPIAAGQHFAVDVAVCAKAGARPPQDLRVDANMPAHRHGMNYRAGVSRKGDGSYRAEGLMFHMPGRWELTFDVVAGNTTERLASTLDVR